MRAASVGPRARRWRRPVPANALPPRKWRCWRGAAQIPSAAAAQPRGPARGPLPRLVAARPRSPPGTWGLASRRRPAAAAARVREAQRHPRRTLSRGARARLPRRARAGAAGRRASVDVATQGCRPPARPPLASPAPVIRARRTAATARPEISRARYSRGAEEPGGKQQLEPAPSFCFSPLASPAVPRSAVRDDRVPLALALCGLRAWRTRDLRSGAVTRPATSCSTGLLQLYTYLGVTSNYVCCS